jgi:hypothetical protein
MKKVAIFLEGHTETIFVKQLLLLHHNWSADIECNQLMAGGNLGSVIFDHKVLDPEYHYRLICVGNDSIVLRSMLQREKYLCSAGYTVIIGLRDMYCQQYEDDCKEVEKESILKFINKTKETIQNSATNPLIMSFCYAIMEIESWMIGLNIFPKVDPQLTEDKIQHVLKFNPVKIDPEPNLFKPSNSLAQIYGSVGLSYDKSQSAVMSFCSKLEHKDFTAFLERNTCSSFHYFHTKLFGAQ